MVRDISDLKLEEITEEFLRDECIEMGTALEVDTRQGSLYRDAAEGHILRTAKFFDDLRKVAQIISITTCTGEVLDERLWERGLARNPPAATPAKYYVDFVGATPKIGDIVTCERYFFTVDMLDGRYIIVSEDCGSEMNNLVKGSLVIPEIDVDNLISATLSDLAVPALDQESDESARERLLNKISGPDENGNKSQIKSWCESVEGVGRARIVPLWNGPNTVMGIIISQDGGVPAAAVVEAVQEYLDPGAQGLGEGVATIGQIFTAQAVEAVKVNISVTVVKRAEASYSGIREAFIEAMENYCKEIALEPYSEEIKVRYNRVSAILTNLPDVFDHENLRINGSTGNVDCTMYQIPVLGEVEVNGDIL